MVEIDHLLITNRYMHMANSISSARAHATATRVLRRFGVKSVLKCISQEASEMIQTVTWRSSLEEARLEAREQGKELMVDLFNPG